ncbi:MAG: phosphodiester glycosidase family protein [Candidatus Sericytochromatia bacterium]|nr:phosphodiester glycosidase family protein [Candidatus Sericytochromatia bacterium]
MVAQRSNHASALPNAGCWPSSAACRALTFLALLGGLGGAPTAALAAGPNGKPQSASQVFIDRNKTRIRLPLSHARVVKRTSRVTGYSLEATGRALGSLALERAVHQGALHHLRIHTFENKTYLKADWRFAAPVEVRLQPDALELVFHHRLAPPVFRAVARGVGLWEGQRWTGAGPMRVRALRLDPRHVKLEPAIATAGGKRMGLSRVSSFGQWHGAIAAVNGSYFSPANGEPQGTVVIDRQLISRTMLDRPSLWFQRSGDVAIRVAKPAPRVVLEDGTSLPCQGLNEAARRNRLTLYTAHFGLRTRTVADPSRQEVAVNAGGRVVGLGSGNLEIPSGGYVLSGQGSAATLLRRTIGDGQHLRLDSKLPPNVEHALGGGPTLVQGGKVRVLARQQHFRADVAKGRSPRTAVGLTRDDRYLVVTIDGRQPGYSVGATLSELAGVLRDLGAVEALNLDGGGSTTMWLRGRTLGRPSDGHERPVSTALLVLPRKAEVAAAPGLRALLAAWGGRGVGAF